MNPPSVSPLPFRNVRISIPPRLYRCGHDWAWDHRLSDHDLWIVLSGKGELCVDGQRLPLAGPQAVLFCPGEHVLGRHNPSHPLEVFALHFTPLGMAAGGNIWRDRMRSFPLRPVELFRELCGIVIDQLRPADALARAQAAVLAMTLLTTLWRAAHASSPETGDDRLERLIKLIQRESWQPWTLRMMADQAAMGTTRLNLGFRRHTGFTPMQWVVHCRIEQAMILLRETNIKIAAIADACGYRDVYFFSRQFRQFTRQAPAEWRRTEIGHQPGAKSRSMNRDSAARSRPRFTM